MDGLSWKAFERELERRGGVRCWLRDDDAAQPTPALQRLLDLCSARKVPLALAAVPLNATPELFAALKGSVSVLQHGTDHRNRAGPHEKKTEFPASEPEEAALERLAAAHARLKALAGERAAPVFVPPWNRIRPALAQKLPSIGIRALSQHAKAPDVQGLAQINTHVDIVAWREGRRFIGEREALATALAHLDGAQPLGWLTHHAVHDEAAWRFLERLFAMEAIRWAKAVELFSYTAPGHG